MARTSDYDFLAPESTVGAVADHDDFAVDPDTDGGFDADDVFDGLASGLYDDAVEREVRELLGRVFGM